MPVGPLLPRRAALALGVAGVALLTGCDNDDKDPAATPSPDPDVALVDGVVAQLSVALRAATRAGNADLVQLHRAHLRALDGSARHGADARVPRVSLREREKVLQAGLANASMAAQSGELARLLASMSAAVSQRLVTL
ncbi:hypothetical protein ABLE68_16300 [Nocardioides sp. CN2-186]|uniref:hypothetical protein n=1 Tax=Nocardioides tweenelious TaxID=3156607 RepID=UPI0032B47A1F